MQCSLAIFLQEAMRQRVDAYRKRYDPDYRRISPHIMVKESFTMTSAQIPTVIALLQDLAQKVPPFTICLRAIRLHLHNQMLYFAIQTPERVTHLHQIIEQKLGDQFPSTHTTFTPGNFTPRLPIGQKLPVDELHDLYSSLRLRKFAWDSTIRSFHLLVFQEDEGTWTTRHTFSLTATPYA